MLLVFKSAYIATRDVTIMTSLVGAFCFGASYLFSILGLASISMFFTYLTIVFTGTALTIGIPLFFSSLVYLPMCYKDGNLKWSTLFPFALPFSAY